MNMQNELSAQQKYEKKRVQFLLKYSIKEADEGQRLKSYLELTGQSANSYLKELVRKDLDSKGV